MLKTNKKNNCILFIFYVRRPREGGLTSAVKKLYIIPDWSTNVIRTESSVRLSLSIFSTGPPPFLVFSSRGTISSSTSMSFVIPDTTTQQPGMASEFLLSAACECELLYRCNVVGLPSIRTGFTAALFNSLSATVHENIRLSSHEPPGSPALGNDIES